MIWRPRCVIDTRCLRPIDRARSSIVPRAGAAPRHRRTGGSRSPRQPAPRSVADCRRASAFASRGRRPPCRRRRIWRSATSFHCRSSCHADLGRGGRSAGGARDPGHAEIAVAARWLNDRLRDALLRRGHAAPPVTICSGTLLAARGGSARHAPLHNAPRAALPMLRALRRGLRSSTTACSWWTVRSRPARASRRGSTSRCTSSPRSAARPWRRASPRTWWSTCGVRRATPSCLHSTCTGVISTHGAPGTGRGRHRPAARLGHGVARPGRPRGRASSVAAVHRPRRRSPCAPSA